MAMIKYRPINTNFAIASCAIKFLLLLGSAAPSYAALPLLETLCQKPTSVAEMLEKKALPAVVNVVSFTAIAAEIDPSNKYFYNPPDNGDAEQQYLRRSGTGVIIDSKRGTIITNHGLVLGADSVKVVLQDQRSLMASVVGVDPDIDLAVLDVDADNLVAINMADSDKIKVGDFSVAISDSFDLGKSVATGMVSSIGGRAFNGSIYEIFVQTEASLNQLHSGGILIDLQGNLLGMNAAIIKLNQMRITINLIAPSNILMSSVAQIFRYGDVVRGDLAVAVQNLTPELKHAFNIPKDITGVVITQSEQAVAGAPGSKSVGVLKPGDMILEIDGKQVANRLQLIRAIYAHRFGDEIELKTLREGRINKIAIKLGAKYSDAKSPMESTINSDKTLGDFELRDGDSKL
jgi:S1-C subfamily serine protease